MFLLLAPASRIAHLLEPAFLGACCLILKAQLWPVCSSDAHGGSLPFVLVFCELSYTNSTQMFSCVWLPRVRGDDAWSYPTVPILQLLGPFASDQDTFF